MRFSLPVAASPSTSRQRLNGEPVEVRLYQVERGGLSFGISAYTLANADRSYDPRRVYRALVASLRAQGADDAALSRVRDLRVDGYPAVDATFRFTSAQGKLSYWRLRSIATKRGALGLTVLTFANPDDAAARHRVDAAFARLAASVSVGR
jgi:hypothetical protein